MVDPDEPADKLGMPTPREIRTLVEHEVRLCRDQLEVRAKEAEAMVTAYERGEIDYEGFCARFGDYRDKWGDPEPQRTDEMAQVSADDIKPKPRAESLRRQIRDAGHRNR